MPNFEDEIMDVNEEREEDAVLAKLKKPREYTAEEQAALKDWDDLARDIRHSVNALDEALAAVDKHTTEIEDLYSEWISDHEADTSSWVLEDLKTRARVYIDAVEGEVSPRATKKKKAIKKKAKKKKAQKGNLTAYDKAVAIKDILQKKAEILGKDLDKKLAAKLGIDVKKITQQFFTPTLEGETLNLRQTSDRREGTQKYIHKKNTLIDCNKIIKANK